MHLPRTVAEMQSQVLIRKWYACGSMNIILVAMASKEMNRKANNAAWGIVCTIASLKLKQWEAISRFVSKLLGTQNLCVMPCCFSDLTNVPSTEAEAIHIYS